MSLILEALKKLEREKQAPERGVVVVGAAAWPGARSDRRLGLFLLGLAIGGAALGGLALWRQRPGAPEPAPPVTLAAVPPKAAVTPDTLPPPPRDTRPAAVERLVLAAKPAAVAPSVKPAAQPPFVLQAISERDGHPVAVVNDRLLREGDSIDGARIVRIAKDEVELELAGRRLTLRF